MAVAFRVVSFLLLIVYLSVALVLTLTPAGGRELAPNLVPLAGIAATFRDSSTWFGISQLVGNILLLLPLGILLRLSVPRVRPLAVIAAGLTLSICIELAQWRLVSGRMADIDDVWLNTLGCAIGVGLASLAGRLATRWSAR